MSQNFGNQQKPMYRCESVDFENDVVNLTQKLK